MNTGKSSKNVTKDLLNDTAIKLRYGGKLDLGNNFIIRKDTDLKHDIKISTTEQISSEVSHFQKGTEINVIGIYNPTSPKGFITFMIDSEVFKMEIGKFKDVFDITENLNEKTNNNIEKIVKKIDNTIDKKDAK